MHHLLRWLLESSQHFILDAALPLRLLISAAAVATGIMPRTIRGATIEEGNSGIAQTEDEFISIICVLLVCKLPFV